MDDFGMLWMSSSKGLTTTELINEAIDYYVNKYGGSINRAHINPARFEKGVEYPVQIFADIQVQMNHVWVGYKE